MGACAPRGRRPARRMGGNRSVGPREHDRTMRFALCAVVAMVVGAPVAAADPTPAPPGYQIPGPSGPQFPGMQTYQPTCLTAPLACGFRYHPDTGTWQPGDQ